VSKSVGVLLVVLDLDFVVNLLVDVESELEFISGSVGETLRTEDGGGFGKMHHL